MTQNSKYVVDFQNVDRADVPLVGGKNASLGEMIRELGQKDIKVPPGFATTSDAYRLFLKKNDLDARIGAALVDWANGKQTLQETGAAIRALIIGGDWPDEIASEIKAHYRDLSSTSGRNDVPVAVRSSATAEDLPDASFAGQQETFLNVTGEGDLLDACRRCYASLFTDRAITYRQVQGFDHQQVALSVGVQRMVSADVGGSGVMFSIDTESGFPDAVLINAAWGLGENVVQGAVDPDEYQVFKPFLDRPNLVPILEKRKGAKEIKMIHAKDGTPTNVPTSKAERAAFVLSDQEILELSRYAKTIEDHYGQPMDMEWARDGVTRELFIVQARPETVQSRADSSVIRSYSVPDPGELILTGLSVGSSAVAGRVCLIEHAADIDKFIDGSILVTGTTDPDWMPIMKRAAAIVTDHGGRTSHAAIVSRELGLPAVVGCGNATHVLHDLQDVTVSCAGGDEGAIYSGLADVEIHEERIDDIPFSKTNVMLNLANPSAAFRWWHLPVDGVGLARMEFVVNNAVRIHPMALAHFERVTDPQQRSEIENLTQGYTDMTRYFVDHLSQGLSRIAALCYPKPVIVRMSDFKTNEYAALLGGSPFEPHEENPMIGFRGASRYYSDNYKDGFALECQAIKRLRGEMGFDNVIIMIPFCRTPEEADKVLSVMAENGLERGKDGLQIYMMCEIPTNVIRASEFATRFDGFSIGSNDLTQLTLGIDRDSEELAALFDEADPAVLWMIETVIKEAHEAGIKIGFCGQAPSNHPQFAQTLASLGIDSISVTPDSFVTVLRNVAIGEGG